MPYPLQTSLPCRCFYSSSPFLPVRFSSLRPFDRGFSTFIRPFFLCRNPFSLSFSLPPHVSHCIHQIPFPLNWSLPPPSRNCSLDSEGWVLCLRRLGAFLASLPLPRNLIAGLFPQLHRRSCLLYAAQPSTSFQALLGSHPSPPIRRLFDRSRGFKPPL